MHVAFCQDRWQRDLGPLPGCLAISARRARAASLFGVGDGGGDQAGLEKIGGAKRSLVPIPVDRGSGIAATFQGF